MDINEKTLGGRYAKAFLRLEESAENAERLYSELRQMREKTRPLDDYLNHPVLNSEVKLALLGKILPGESRASDFIKLLAAESRYGIIDSVLEEARKAIDERSGISRGIIEISAAPARELTEKVRIALEKMSGKKVILSERIDSGVIGGFRVVLGDFFIDASLKGRLEKLKKELLKGGIYD